MKLSSKNRLAFWGSASLVALGVGLTAMPNVAMAQAAAAPAATTNAATDGDEEVIVVVGMRRALQNAQTLRRNADTVVDSITATDLGSFPDKSVAEALQRVAGITVNRFAASSDTAHFSAEPSGVIVRGLNFVRNEFNGRDTFSANSSRGLSWGDISPELLGGVDTYKNITPELVEGGIAGTVNLRTRLPFDAPGQAMVISGALNYGDNEGSITPDVSGLYSNQWENEAGRFGFMVNAAYSEVRTRSEGVQMYRMNRFRDINVAASGGDAAYRYGTGQGLFYIPANINFRDNIYHRTRTGEALAAQWESPSGNLLATFQYLRSQYDNAWEEYVVGSSVADLSFSQDLFFELGASNANAPQPAPGTPQFTFDSNGMFQSGTLTSDIGWWGANATDSAGFAANNSGGAMVTPCYGWNGCYPTQRSSDATTSTRSNNNTNITEDFGFNLKWDVSERLHFQFDAQHVNSQVDNYDIDVGMASFATPTIDLTGQYPTLNLTNPLVNVNLSPGGLAEPSNYRYHYIMDHLEESSGTEDAFKIDGQYEVQSPWIDSVKFGYRHAERHQDVNWSGYNWANVANTWSSNGCYYNITRHAAGSCNSQNFKGYPQGTYEVRSFHNVFGENLLNPNQFVFFNMDLEQNRTAMAAALGSAALGFTGGQGWEPICSNSGGRSQEIAGTCYTPAEMADVTEATDAAYVMLKFGGPDARLGGFGISGNVGARYVTTTVTSSGGQTNPRLGDEFFFRYDSTLPTGSQRVPRARSVANIGCAPITAGPGQPTPPVPQSVGCYLSADDINFMLGGSSVSTTENTVHNWLPSFNLKVDLTDEWVLRFAASRAISRPDIGNLRNYLGVSQTLPAENNAQDPLWVRNSAGVITGANVKYTASAQNPFLRPVTATQFDLALEHYFAAVGSFTLTAFYKDFQDYIQFGVYNRSMTINGVTRTVETRGPVNGDGASISGLEIAYQRYFDFLPGAWSGLGIQANYTYIKNSGISNTNVSNVLGDATTVTGQAPNAIQSGRLEGLSDNSANVVLMYEHGPIGARLAYSWRDEYLVTAIDCCVAYSIWNDPYGQLDGSLRYNVNDHLEINFQAQNIMNTTTRTYQQVTNSDANGRGLLLPTGIFQQGRRFTLAARYRF